MTPAEVVLVLALAASNRHDPNNVTPGYIASVCDAATRSPWRAFQGRLLLAPGEHIYALQSCGLDEPPPLTCYEGAKARSDQITFGATMYAQQFLTVFVVGSRCDSERPWKRGFFSALIRKEGA